MKHLILVGACYLDTILSVPHFPEEDSKLRATRLQMRRGGNCPNTLEVFQQLLQVCDHDEQSIVQTHLVSVLPAKHASATVTILSSFGGRGDASRVDFSHCIYREDNTEPASSYIIRSGSSGSRTIVNFSSLAEMTVQEFSAIAADFEQDGGRDCWWHFEGRIPETTLQCIQHLRDRLPQSKLSVEVEKPNRDGLREMAAKADVVFYSKSWAESHGYDSAGACLRGEMGKLGSHASLACCTWGALGATALRLPDQELLQSPVRLAAEHRVIDTVGAGDTFIAGILFGQLKHCCAKDWSDSTQLRFAVDLAAQKVQVEGFAGLAHKMGMLSGCEKEGTSS